MRWFMGQEQAYRVFSTDNEEKLGDGLETVLGWGNVCQYRPMLEATFLKFVRETSHMTGLNRKRSGAVKYMEVPSKTVWDIMDRLEYLNPFIDIEEAGSSGQKRKAGESDEGEADRSREPVVPGGNDSAQRLAVHFGVFAPWDSENISTKTATHDVKEGDDLIAIYVPTRKLSVYQSGFTSGGTIVAFETIPFKEIRAIWSFKSTKKGPVKEVRRIYSRAVESEICPGFKDAAGVTPADFLGNLNSFLDGEDSADADILKKMVVDACVNIGVPEALGKSLVEIRDLLSRFIVYREDDPSSISNRVCPACAIIIPRRFCYCAACECELISTGKFVIHVDDNEPKPSDTTNVTEEVKQAQREAKEGAERFVAEEERPNTQEMS